MIVTDYQELINKAISAREYSYSPYSEFKVGAALLCKNGKIYTGCNVENAAYGETICAERTAVLKAVSSGEREFCAIAIVGGKDALQGFAYPCGACRQVMSEFCQPEFEIVLFDGENTQISTLGQLFPCSFSKTDLK